MLAHLIAAGEVVVIALALGSHTAGGIHVHLSAKNTVAAIALVVLGPLWSGQAESCPWLRRCAGLSPVRSQTRTNAAQR
ncbi:hypothetical protein I552_1960 [Mycobacterium xenopi 3993]|nr:hypothetical protein I552_1960 [Mycobacterium xenopi 3993]